MRKLKRFGLRSKVSFVHGFSLPSRQKKVDNEVETE